jgi:hypothetical protein
LIFIYCVCRLWSVGIVRSRTKGHGVCLFVLYVDYRICIAWVLHQELRSYRVKERLHLGVGEQKHRISLIYDTQDVNIKIHRLLTNRIKWWTVNLTEFSVLLLLWTRDELPGFLEEGNFSKFSVVLTLETVPSTLYLVR